MKKIEVLEQIKLATSAIESFFSGKQSEVQPEVFESIKVLDSDQSLSYAELVVGAEVSISTAEGSQPAADGEYELEGGIKLTVKDGLIESFIQPEDAPADEVVELTEEKEEEKSEEEVPAEDAPADEEVKEEELAEPSELETMKAEIADLKAQVAELVAMISGVATKEDVAEFSNQITVLNSALEIAINTPAEFSKTDKSHQNREDKQNKMNRIADISSQMKGK